VYRFRHTARLDRSLARIEELKASIDSRGPLPRIWRGRLRRDLEAEAVAASTRIEGVAVTVDEARRILAGDRPSSVSPDDADLVDGYRGAMEYVLARADASAFAWHSELLLGIHHRVLGGSHALGAGRFREGQNWLTNHESGQQVYLPPSPELVPELVAELCVWLSSSAEPAAVSSAIAHLAVAGIHPFKDGNGRTARISASLAMYRGGFRSPQFTSLEEWWGRHVKDYYAAFECLGSEWDRDTDVTEFVEAHASAQATQVEALSLRNASEHALWTLLEDVAVHDLGLHERVTHALYDAFFARGVTNRYYRNMADVSDVTASHDLGKLAASGLVEARGAGRSSHYVPTATLYRRVVESGELDSRWAVESGTPEEMRDAVLAGLAAGLHAPLGCNGTPA
jgi:Fic family protein